MMEKRFLGKVASLVEYIGSTDCMISGSRSGLSPIFLKHVIDTVGYEQFRKGIEYSMELADYLVNALRSAWRNQNSLTVMFPRVSDAIINKWQLATNKDISHVICLPHVTREKLDEFISEAKSYYKSQLGTPEQNLRLVV